MFLSTLKHVAACTLCVFLLSAGAALLVKQTFAEGSGPLPAAPKAGAQALTAEPERAHGGTALVGQENNKSLEGKKRGTDIDGDSLPPGVLARMGSLLFRHKGGHPSFASDSKSVLISGQDGFVQSWDVATGNKIQSKQLARPTDKSHAHAALISPDGKIVAMREEKVVHLYSLADGSMLRTLPAGPAQQHRLAFSPDSKLIAVLAGKPDQSAVRLWDTATGDERLTLKHAGALLAVAISNDGQLLLSADSIGLHLWSLATGKELRNFVITRRGIGQPDQALAFSPDDKIIASARGGTVTLLDTATMKQLATLAPSKRMRFGIHDCRAFSPDGRMLAVGGEEQLVLWDVPTRKELRRLPEWQAWALAFSPDGKTLACAGWHNLHLWDVGKGQPLHERQGHDILVYKMAEAPNGKALASIGLRESNVLLWDTSSGTPLGALQGHTDWVYAISFSPDGKQLISGGLDGTVRLWDFATRMELRRFVVETPGDAVTLCGLSQDGKQLAAISGHDSPTHAYQLWLWDLATSKLLVRRAYADWAAFCFTPDGKGLAVKNKAGLTIEELATGQPLYPPIGGTLGSSYFSYDGKLVVTGVIKYLNSNSYQNQHFIVSEVATGKEVFRIKGPDWCDDFFRNGQVLATHSGDSIHLWDVGTGKQLHQLKSSAYSVCPLRDGRSVATGLDGIILVLDLQPEKWQGPAKNQALSTKELEALWADLASDDAPKAHRAIYVLASTRDQAMPMLRSCLQPVAPAAPKLVERLVTDLNSEKYAVRQAASKELAALGEQTEPALRQALKGKPPLETQQRIAKLLLEFRATPAPATLRSLRAIRALELIATPSAKQILQQLASGATLARESREAKNALDRINTK